MKQLLPIIGLIVLIISCKKDSKNDYPEYYRMYNNVMKLEKAGKSEEAFKLFQEAERLVDFIPVQHLLEARNLAILAEDCDLILEYFQKAVNNGFEYEQFQFASNICPEISNSSVKGIEIDQHYKSEVESMYAADQAARNGSSTSTMNEVDSENIEKLLALIEKKGYPSSKLIGNMAAGKAFILLLHFDSDIGNKRLKPILDTAYDEGMISPESYAWIIDRRRHWGPEKLDPYYYQLPTQKYFEMTAEEISEIDKRRNTIGLRPLSEMNISRTENGGISVQN